LLLSLEQYISLILMLDLVLLPVGIGNRRSYVSRRFLLHVSPSNLSAAPTEIEGIVVEWTYRVGHKKCGHKLVAIFLSNPNWFTIFMEYSLIDLH